MLTQSLFGTQIYWIDLLLQESFLLKMMQRFLFLSEGKMRLLPSLHVMIWSVMRQGAVPLPLYLLHCHVRTCPHALTMGKYTQ